MSENEKNWKDWLIFADDDLAVAQDLARTDHHGAACFHAQQCVEKTLKAAVLSLGYDNVRTHNLLALENIISKHFAHLDQFQVKLNLLNVFYHSTRYPNGMPLAKHPIIFNQSDSNAAIEAALEITEFVKIMLFDEV